jgi:hypothetical protein
VYLGTRRRRTRRGIRNTMKEKRSVRMEKEV